MRRTGKSFERHPPIPAPIADTAEERKRFGWYYDESAGKCKVPFKRYNGKVIHELDLGLIRFLLALGEEYRGPRDRYEEFAACANRYLDGLREYVDNRRWDVVAGEPVAVFLPPAIRTDTSPGRPLKECRNKRYWQWCLRVKFLRDKYPLFFAAVKHRLENSNPQNNWRDIGERTDRGSSWEDDEMEDDERAWEEELQEEREQDDRSDEESDSEGSGKKRKRKTRSRFSDSSPPPKKKQKKKGKGKETPKRRKLAKKAVEQSSSFIVNDDDDGEESYCEEESSNRRKRASSSRKPTSSPKKSQRSPNKTRRSKSPRKNTSKKRRCQDVDEFSDDNEMEGNDSEDTYCDEDEVKTSKGNRNVSTKTP
ncbi:hypothetical protein MKEN_01254300 [Mycena kentingensis (nom. inval.)]|nr:hypothetical protein MKEN_01254300 [Mycena kentingensis (nom. inval.)]